MKCHFTLIFLILLKESCGQVKLCDENDERDWSLELITKPTTTTTPKPMPKGPFYNFIVKICETLITRFKPRKVGYYFEILRKALKGLGTNFFMKLRVKYFRQKLKKLSHLNGNRLKEVVREFLSLLREGKPDINEFFFAMDKLFTVSLDIKMDDYVYELKRYGAEFNKRTMKRKTRDVFRRLIFAVLEKQHKHIRFDIEYKFQKAYIEYKEKH